ncbi:hypothetical protein B6J58_00375 [Klebsiella quasipneumoniae]|uniref:Uncharacterized protein n=1 Tax=Klebsiella quasipneumoniae TaxID=1463165 RepID=A0A2A5MPN3_9ENTR|nr:hypothetical protein AL473_01665 [Klebsiella quasipneumoniae]AVO80104.1 hypothetical protein AM459_24540 [Klebsiella pneumoniae]AWB63387.1 hypothetical protein CUC76_18275 [Enterobacteriaceae bacterium S05]AWO61937.1 hypothetical protein DLJ73_13325 [Klebsiella quasipneumoniae subsp. similipneumoniae]AWX85643.1 hypothetical protein DP204_03025 [Klebsiella quasipneumoniae subsp. quasipneumoniae]AZZ18599.1 hypothetical protein CE636_12370 [Klebsiella sp. LY]
MAHKIILTKHLMGKHRPFLRHNHNIFTESYLHRLAKAGICFTFGTHKVKIKNSLRCVGITQRGDDYT